jgi:hypothetical protein
MGETVTVAFSVRHNLGNYEHAELKVEVGAAAEPGEALSKASELQAQLVKLVSRERWEELQQVRPAAVATVEVKAPAATPVQDATEPAKAEEAPAQSGDILDEQPKRRGRPPSKAKPKDDASDPLSIEESGAATPTGLRRSIIAWAAASPANHATLTRTLQVTGFDKLRDVPDDELPALVAVLGLDV